MTKSLSVFFLSCAMLSGVLCPCSFAGSPEPVRSVDNQAGTADEVIGHVRATTPPVKIPHLLKNGDKIFMGDKIETGSASRLTILLVDGTVFRLGPLSTITVDEFVYDPNNPENKSQVMKGVFRAVSGKVAGKKQEDREDPGALLDAMDEMDRKK